MDILFSFINGNKEDPLTTKELIIYIVIITLIVAFAILIWYFTIGKKRMYERKERLTETPLLTPAEQKCIDQNMKCIIDAPKDVNGNTIPDAQQKCDTENMNCIMNLPFSM